tara:strand:- start:8273 stop:12280 length:4008 start_codon:yes stop_codon:yes gene_type:complete
MLKRVSLYILFVCLLPLFGVAQKFNWANNFSNSSNKSTSSLANTNTGSSFVGGYFDGVLNVSGTNMTAKGGKDNFVTVYAKNGVLLWNGAIHYESNGSNDDINSSYFDSGSSTFTTCGKLDGNTFLKFGSAKIDSHKFAKSNYFVSCFSTGSASLRWSFPENGTTNSEANAVTGDGNGNVYVAGRFNDSLELSPALIGASNGDLFLMKIQISTGNKLWAKKITGLGTESVSSIIYDRTNNQAVVLGNYEDTMYLGSTKLAPFVKGNKAVFAARFDSNGTAFTLKAVFESTSDIELLDADIRTSSAGYVVSGRFKGVIQGPLLVSKGGYDIFMATVSATDIKGIVKGYGGNSNDEGNEIEITATGITYVHATYESSVFTFGSSTISKKGVRDVCILASALNLSPIGGKGAGLMSLSADQIYATAMSQSAGVLVIGNRYRGRVVYGKKGTFSSPAGFFDLAFAQISPSSIYCNTNDTLAFSGFRSVIDTHHLCANSNGEIKSLADTTFKFEWYKIGFSTVLGRSYSLSVTDSANYLVVIKDSISANAVCLDSSQVAIVIMDTLPTAIINGDTSTCNNISSNFPINTTPVFTNFSTDSLFGRGIGNNTMNSYNPSNPGVGTGVDIIVFQRINSVTGCIGQDTAEVIVNASPSISITGVKTYCQGEPAGILRYATSPGDSLAKYSMSSPSWGIKNDSVFRCDSLSNGFHRVKYSVTDTNNCLHDTTISLEIKQIPAVALNLSKSSACKNSSVFNLSGQTPTGGYFVGVGVTDSSTGAYNPDSAFYKKDTITYVFAATNGCVNMASDVFTIDTIPIVSFVYSDTLCDGYAIYTMKGLPFPSKFPADSGIYSGLPGAISGNKFDPTKATVGSKNKIIYRYVDQKGCSDTMSTIIEVRKLPIVNLPSLGSYCENGGSVLFNSGLPIGGIYSYKKYLLKNNFFKPDTIYINYGADTVYYEYADSFKCVNIAFNFVSVKQKPSLFLNQFFFDKTCNNHSSIDLTNLPVSVVSPPPYSFWASSGYFSYDSTLINKIDFFDPKKYAEQGVIGRRALTYTYTDSLSSCTDTLGVFPDVKIAPVVVINHLGSACVGLNHKLNASGGLTWEWSTGDSTSSIIVKQDSSSEYFAIGKLGICYDTATAKVDITQGEKIIAKDDSVSLQKGKDVTLDPIARLYSKDTINLIGSFKIFLGPNEARSFDTTGGVIDKVNSNIYYEPNLDFRRTDSSFYEVCNVNCINICDTAKVIFHVLGNPYEFIPSAFTPNGDGINDFWVVPGIEAFPKSELFIYNRWGDLVYESIPYENKWQGESNKGTARGKKMGDGTYYYVLKTNDGDPLKGTIELKTQ